MFPCVLCVGGMFFQSLGSPDSGSCESEPESLYPLISSEYVENAYRFSHGGLCLVACKCLTTVIFTDTFIKTEKAESRLTRPRGRPPKLSSSSVYSVSKKSKHGENIFQDSSQNFTVHLGDRAPHVLAAPRGTHLWEFIRDILINPEKNQGLMKWEDRHEGVFKFLKSEAVAQMWGQKKKNTSMTYEKLSRAMR